MTRRPARTDHPVSPPILAFGACYCELCGTGSLVTTAAMRKAWGGMLLPYSKSLVHKDALSLHNRLLYVRPDFARARDLSTSRGHLDHHS
jgi:hypothetical protein